MSAPKSPPKTTSFWHFLCLQLWCAPSRARWTNFHIPPTIYFEENYAATGAKFRAYISADSDPYLSWSQIELKTIPHCEEGEVKSSKYEFIAMCWGLGLIKNISGFVGGCVRYIELNLGVIGPNLTIIERFWFLVIKTNNVYNSLK